MNVSIIVPVYNSEKYLTQCIESMISQTYSKIEIILVDDGSTDNSLDICRYYSKVDNRIKVVHKINGGASSARNAGLTEASGSYIMFVDSDDYIYPYMVEVLLQNIEEYNTDLVVCGMTAFSEESINSTIYKKAFYDKKRDIAKFFSLLDGRTNSLWNKLYKKELINHKFNEELVIGEDLIFNLEYFENCKSIAVVDKALYFYRRTSHESLTQIYHESFFNINNFMYEKTLKYLNKTLEGTKSTISTEKIDEEYYKNLSSYLSGLVKSNDYKSLQKIEYIKNICNDKTVISVNNKPKKIPLKYKTLSVLMKLNLSRTIYMIIKGWNFYRKIK